MARPVGTRKYSPDQLANAVQDYLKEKEEKNEFPLGLELCQKIDITKETLRQWELLPDYSAPIKKLREASELWLVKNVAVEGKPIGKMFLLKANHGYVEKQHDTNINLTLNMGQILDQLEGKETRRIDGTVVDVDPPTTPIPPLGEGDEKNDTP